jgi:transcriptional regulator with XRE-family HTH domain
MDYAKLSMEFLRALRGGRSQVAWSRRLGYRSNVAYSWEKGRRWPTAAESFRAAERNGADLRDSLERFFGKAVPEWVGALNLTTAAAVARLLDEMRGSTTIAELARRTGISRYAISRWLSGHSEPRLPDFFLLFEASSTRLIDLVSVLVDPSELPTVAEQVRLAELRRSGAYQLPWTQGVLRALELEAYRDMPAHEPGWVGRQLGVSMAVEAECFAFLLDTEQVSWNGTHYIGSTVAVDTRGRPEIGRRLKSHWGREAADRIDSGAPGQFSYVVFSASKVDFERIRELHLRYFNSLRGIISDSSPNEVVAVANVQLFGLEKHESE